MINNKKEVLAALQTRKGTLASVVEAYGNVQAKVGTRYSCNICGSSNNLCLYVAHDKETGEDVEMYSCKTPGCALHTGTVVKYMQVQESISEDAAIIRIAEDYATEIEVEVDQTFAALEQFFTNYVLHGYTTLRHHYYRDELGEIVACKLLLRNKATNKKEGRWFKCEGDTATMCSKEKGIEVGKMLYNLPDLKDAKRIIFTEGEKDANTLSGLLNTPTTCTQSALEWCDDYKEQVGACTNFVIFTDNDQTGKKAGVNLANRLMDIMGGKYDLTGTWSIKIVKLPMEQDKADITDYCNHLKLKGYSMGKIKQTVEKLIHAAPNMVSIYDAHSDNYGIYKWVIEKGTGAVKKVYITDYTIEVLHREVPLNGGETDKVSCKVTPCHGFSTEPFTVLFTGGSFITVKDYCNAIDSTKCTFMGTSSDVHLINRFINSQVSPEVVVLPHGGIHTYKGKRVYVEQHCTILPNGVLDHSIKTNNDGIKTNINEYAPLTSADIEKLNTCLFNFNSPEITYGVLGYTAALFLKPYIVDAGFSFPILQLIGEAGSGKTQTSAIIQKMLCYPHKPLNAVSGITKHVANQMLGSHNAGALMVDDYKPQNMQLNIINIIKGAVNASYDGTGIRRGYKDMSMSNLELKASIVLTGERGLQEASATERSYTCYFNKRSALAHSKGFYELAKHMPLLNQLGKTLTLYSLNVDPTFVVEKFTHIMSNINAKHTRMANTVGILMLGLNMIKELGFKIDLAQAQEYLLSNIEHSAETEAITEVEKHLQIMSRVLNNQPNDAKGIALYMLSDGEVLVRFRALYDNFTSYIKAKGIDFKPLSLEQFLTQLETSNLCAYADREKWNAPGRFPVSGGFGTAQKVKQRGYKLVTANLLKIDGWSELFTEEELLKLNFKVIEGVANSEMVELEEIEEVKPIPQLAPILPPVEGLDVAF